MMKIKIVLFVVLSIALSASAEIFELKNDKLQFQIDDKGNLVSLKNLW